MPHVHGTTKRLLALAIAFSLAWAGSASAAHRPAHVPRRAIRATSRTAHAAHRGRPHGRKAPPRVTALSVLGNLLRSGAIERSAYDSCRATYLRAAESLRKLSGTRRTELGAVLANVEVMARTGKLVPSRLPVVFTTLQRNWEWWTSKPLLGSGQRVSFPGSRLVWEHYSGQGIEIQWLATFGEANGYWFSHDNAALAQVLGEAIALATQRAGGIAWEYMFVFDGGTPPWTSALSQGTALQALARAWSATHEQRFLTAAQQALGIFQTGPPEGVSASASSSGGQTGASAPAGSGAWYLQYTYAPGEHIINGFIQALVGLYDYTKLTGDPLGQQLFEAGDAQARAQLPHFDTGAWSLYDQHSESDLSYHDLLTEFLEHLCERTREIAGDQIYCTTAEHFKEDLKTPPKVQLLTSTVNARERAGVQIKLSKVSTVSLTITLGKKTVWSNRATVEGGTPRLLWVTPSEPGAYGVVLRATDLAGNEEVASGAIVVKAVPKRGHKRNGRGGPQRGKPAPKAKTATTRSAPISPPARRLPAL